MANDWSRTESRVVRPFLDVKGILDNVCIRLSPDMDWKNSTSINLENVDIRNFQPEFKMNINRSIGFPYEIDKDDISLIVSMEDIRLHRREKIFEWKFNEIPEIVSIPETFYKHFGWIFGFRATVALILNKKRAGKVGEPTLRGHWIDRKDFSVAPERETSSFPIERWTADDFERHNLPKRTSYWFEIFEEGLYREIEDPRNVFRLALRDKVYDSLVRNEKNNVGKAIINLITTEIVTDILMKGFTEPREGDIIEDKSILRKAIKNISKSLDIKEEDIEKKISNYAREDDRSSVRAYVQTSFKLDRLLARLERSD